MRIRKKLVIILLLSVFILSSLYSTSTYALPPNYEPSKLNVNVNNVLEHLRKLSSFAPRISGYPQCEEAAKYIADVLSSYGYNVTLEEFNVTVPYEQHSELVLYTQIGAQVIKAYALLPNTIETSYTDGLEGEVIYVETKYGDLRDFEGIDVKDKIVALKWDSEKAWRWAAYLGAKGIIFLINNQTRFTEYDNYWKRFWVPIDFPRIAVNEEDFFKLYQLGMQGKIVVKMEYVIKPSYNVIATLPGERKEAIMAITHYDTWSAIPALAQGADDALSAATLLEIARIAAAKKHRYTLIFGFFSGYRQALQGAREFVYKHKDDLLNDIRFVFELSLSSSSANAGIFNRGNFQSYYPLDYDQATFAVRQDFIKLVNETYSKHYGFKLILWDYSPTQAEVLRLRYFDFEIFEMVKIPGIAFGSPAIWEGTATPQDTYETLTSRKDLKPGEVAEKLGSTYLNLLLYLLDDYPDDILKLYAPGRVRTLEGKVVFFNESEGVYKPVPNSIVIVFGMSTARQLPFFVRHYFVVKTDSNGTYVIHTIAPSDIATYAIFPFNDEPPEGPVKYAIDFGTYMRGAFRARMHQAVNKIESSVFRAGTLVFFDVLDPDTASPVSEFLPVLVIDHYTQNYARFFGFVWENVGFVPTPEMSTGTLVVFENPALAQTPRFDAVVDLGGTRWYAAIFNNKTRGYNIKPGTQVIMPFTIFENYIGFRKVDEKRLQEAKRTGLFVDPIERNMNESAANWKKAQEYYAQKKWYEARGSAVLALLLERKAYVAIRTMFFDASYASVFFLLLALPFAYLLERLIFEFEDLKKRAAAFIAIFLAAIAFMVFNHPGFTLIASLPLVAIAFLMLILSIVPLVISFSHATEAIKELRTKFVGKHFAELDKFSAMLMAASLGLRNLRRRWVRTSLLIISIMIATMAFVSIISVLSTRYVAPVATYEVSYGYQGLLIRESSFRPLPSLLSKQIQSAFGDDIEHITEVIFYYPIGQQIEIARTSAGQPITIGAILGLDPADFKIIKAFEENWDAIFTPGSRPFINSNERVCIISAELADLLKSAGVDARIGGKIEILGKRFEIVGIINNSKVYLSTIKDLDGIVIIPFSREVEAGGRVAFRSAQPMDPSEVVIVPVEVAKQMGGQVFAIHITLKNPKKAPQVAEKITQLFRYNVYYALSKDGKYEVTRMATLTSQQVTGQEALIPEVLLMFTILSSILGAVYERTKEIGILSAVGLSPLHVAGIFLMEFTIVAIVSSFLGYMAGISMPTLVTGLKVNAGSMWIVFSILASIGITLAATAYPVRYASRLVTPSFERKWRLEAHAVRRGDTYIVKIPFVISRAEVAGAVLYLKEYLQLFQSEQAEGPFMVERIKYREEKVERGRSRVLDMRVRIKPFDWGVATTTQLKVDTVGKTTTWTIIFKRLSGTEHVWIRGVRQITDVIRKQLLIWRGLKPEERQEYINKARKEGLQ